MTGWVAQLNEFATLSAVVMGRACWQGGLALALAWAFGRVWPDSPPD